MSWRDSDDPRCPECGEEISPTATYCMHCYADLPTEEDADVDDSDDVERSEKYGSEEESTPDRGSVYGDSSGETGTTGETQSASHPSKDWSAEGAFSNVPSPHSLDGIAGALASMIWTDVPEGDGVSSDAVTAPLWMRAPVAFVAGLFVFVPFVGLLLLLFNSVQVPGSGYLFLVGFVGIMYWLGRKPLPSDILGDACYGIALLLLSMPVAFLLNRGLQTLVGAGSFTLRSTALFTVLAAVMTVLPACFFLVVGYVGNRYARSKLDEKAEQSSDAAGS